MERFESFLDSQEFFLEGVSYFSFNCDGSLIAATVRNELWLWEYSEISRWVRTSRTLTGAIYGRGFPFRLVTETRIFHMVRFLPSNDLIVAYHGQHSPNDESLNNIFSVERIDIIAYNGHWKVKSREFLLTQMGKYPAPVTISSIDISACGNMMGACILSNPTTATTYQIVIISLMKSDNVSVGEFLSVSPNYTDDQGFLTNRCFSKTATNLLAGYTYDLMSIEVADSVQWGGRGVRNVTTLGRDVLPRRIPVVDIYSVQGKCKVIRSLYADIEDENNDGQYTTDDISASSFTSMNGISHGVVYGTSSGRLRMFHHMTSAP